MGPNDGTHVHPPETPGWDPTRIFKAGVILKMLGPSESEWTSAHGVERPEPGFFWEKVCFGLVSLPIDRAADRRSDPHCWPKDCCHCHGARRREPTLGRLWHVEGSIPHRTPGIGPWSWGGALFANMLSFAKNPLTRDSKGL